MPNITGRIEALIGRHAALEDRLKDLAKHPAAKSEDVAAIKKEKLEIKGELTSLERELPGA